MKRKSGALSKQYVAALRKHLKSGAGGTMHTAEKLGREAVALGLETLELARIHERSMDILQLAHGKNGLIKRAEAFFAKFLTPIEASHRAARTDRLELQRLSLALKLRTKELATMNRQMQKGNQLHMKAEARFRKSGGAAEKFLEDSLPLEAGLRHLTHKILQAQEQERHTISHQLQDEIAQTLLGINVRLLTLKNEASGNTTNLAKAIASTQRLVEQSVKSINKFARELDLPAPEELPCRTGPRRVGDHY